MAIAASLRKPNAEPASIDNEWIPVLRGRFYCSPRCGCKCTKAAYDTATKKSQELADRLGDGWAPHTWENGGWHWEVAKGPCVDERFGAGGVIVRPNRLGGYSAEFRSALTGTNCTTQFYADAETAEDAIGLVRQDARTFISRLEEDLAASL